MKRYVLRVEGVNFANCLFDTNDLSIIRGASLLLDQVAQPVGSALSQTLGAKLAPLWSGGAKAVFAFEADEQTAAKAESAARESLTRDVWRHMTFVLDMVEETDPLIAEATAEARNRARQFRQWTVADCAVAGAWRQDALDGVRPADPASDNPRGPLAPSSATRIEYGRNMRKDFFSQRSGATVPVDAALVGSFEDLVADPPGGLSLSARGKMAVIHLDGDGFGAAARELKDPARFASEVIGRTDAILDALVKDAMDQELHDGNVSNPVLRLEVLLWGGDDITLVVPAWRALSTLQAFHAAVAGWQISGESLGFTGAAIIAGHKAPIRRLVQLAQEAVDVAKTGGARGAFTIDIFESSSPPEDGLAAHRSRAHQSVPIDCLAFPAHAIADLRQMLARWRQDAGTLYPSRARLNEVLNLGLSEEALAEVTRRDEIRIRGAARDTATDLLKDLRLPRLPHVDRPLSIDLRLVSDLWDYAGGEA